MDKFLIIGKRAINLNLVAFVERPGPGQLNMHFAIPIASIPPGIYPSGTPPVASDHYIEYLLGQEADEVWNRINQMS